MNEAEKNLLYKLAEGKEISRSSACVFVNDALHF